MQTYLPSKSFKTSAKVLTDELLENQIKNCKLLIDCIFRKLGITSFKFKKNTGDKEKYEKTIKHPVFNFWWNNGKPKLIILLRYYEACKFEWFDRGYLKDSHMYNTHFLRDVINNNKDIFNDTSFFLPKRITLGYKIILLSIDKDHFIKIWPNTYKKNAKKINNLKISTERFKFAKFIGFEIPNETD